MKRKSLHRQTQDLLAKIAPKVRGANPLALFVVGEELIYIARHPELFEDWQLGDLDV